MNLKAFFCKIVLQTLLKHGCVDPNLRGEKGSTPLHYCAAKDRDECAKILVRFSHNFKALNDELDHIACFK